MKRPSVRQRLKSALGSWADSGDQEVRDLRESFAPSGLVSIEEAPERERVRLTGTLRTVTLRPRGGVPAIEADLWDGTGVITLVWLGRRRIVGIDPGRSVTVEGRIGVRETHRIMYNPRYELTA
ncbi:OB-fold nucleic acid binding domain-containing protein [Nocardioides sp. AE5]|uniref:OB-fold nucleic acid binding domain-containing protein n=1 Tax=Nocardioides sp. AE5 TaxID=2962573 RepID=UPI0028816DF7|nr:OB-fold nucleic acid binding domain-containing protein [Nocardioides sp. AE5]MDT0201385.1 OB-fold nucleic acid binding domain-containing protein [Nocardioides sp. AE5]